MNALVIGGSRGLGEATARLIAAGGGKTTISYAKGENDARNLQTEINRSRACCSIFKFDALSDIPRQLESLDNDVTHLFYFATLQIFRQNKSVFDSAVLQEFMQIYVSVFNDICLHVIRSAMSRKPTIFAFSKLPTGYFEEANF